MTDKPFYRFKGRQPNPPYTDRLIWYDEADPTQTVETSEWAYWRLWRFHPACSAHPLYEGPPVK